MTDDKIIDKVGKLLTKAEGASTQHEADAFFAKAQELMTKYAIDEMALAHARGKANVKEDIVTEYVTVGSSYHREDIQLYSSVGAANSVRVFIYSARSFKQAALVGYPSDIANVKLMVTSLLIQLGREAKRECPNDMESWERFVWRRSFRSAYATTIGKRLEEARDEAAGDFLPELRSRMTEVDDHIADNMNISQSRRSRRAADASGAASGASAARRADLGGARVSSGTRGELAR